MSDVYGLLEGKTLADPSILDKFGSQIGEVLTKRLSGRDTRDKTKLSLSSVGKPLCQLWYELRGYNGEKLTGSTLLKFLYGDLIEALIIVLAEASGHLVENLQQEVIINGVKGHIDAIIDGVLVDVKSCSPYSFDKFQDGSLFDNDPFGYVGQLSGYARVLKIPAYWIAVDKVSGKACLLELPLSKINEYDVESRIELIKKVTTSETPPERYYEDEADGKSGNRKLGVECSYCNHKFNCWPDIKTYLYASGPRFLTHVEREPNVFKANQ